MSFGPKYETGQEIPNIATYHASKKLVIDVLVILRTCQTVLTTVQIFDDDSLRHCSRLIDGIVQIVLLEGNKIARQALVQPHVDLFLWFRLLSSV